MTTHFDATGPAVVVTHLDVRDPAVVAEARRWSGGRRGAAVPAHEMAGVDLTAFATQAMIVGSKAIAIAGGTQESYNLEAMVAEVGERTAQASRLATKTTDEAVAKATASIEASMKAIRTTVDEIGAQTRRAFAENVDAAGRALAGEVNRLLGGEHPELVARLTPVIEQFGRDLESRSSQQTGELIAKATRQLDPADPASPAAQQARLLSEQQRQATEVQAKGNAELARKLDELTTQIKLAQAATGARAAAERASTLKGKPFEAALHEIIGELATGFGDEYVDTSATVGRYPHNRKGDGVLELHGGEVRVVVEMSDSNRGSGWGAYLDETERNRDARASLGVVRSADQLGGHTVTSLGPRRLLIAFDPETDSVDLLRAVLQLLRLAALSTAQAEQSGEVRVAKEKIAGAIEVLARFDTVTKSVGLIRQHARTRSMSRARGCGSSCRDCSSRRRRRSARRADPTMSPRDEWEQIRSLALPAADVDLMIEADAVILSPHAVERYRERVEGVSYRLAERRLRGLVRTARWRTRPLAWTQVLLRPGVHYGYSTQRSDVCLFLRERRHLVTVMSERCFGMPPPRACA